MVMSRAVCTSPPFSDSSGGARNFKATYSSKPVEKAAYPASRLQLDSVPVLVFLHISDDDGRTSTSVLRF